MLRVKIQKAEVISPSAKLYTLESEDKRTEFLPGQYISFFVDTKKGRAIRPYSVCSQPGQWPRVELCVKQVPNGVGTTYLLENIGNTVEVAGPQGDFVLPQKHGRPLVFIAAGVGVAPVRSQIHFWLDKFPDSSALLIYRFRGSKECLFESQFEDLAAAHKGFSFVKSDSLQEKDFAKVLNQQLPSASNQFFYLVGPPDFVNQVTEKLLALGYSDSDTALDIWE